MDFWIGVWSVFDAQGHRVGTDRISSILQGCAVTEDWTDEPAGTKGLGILYYDNVTNAWSKLYLSESATMRGGIRQRVMIAEYPDGGVRFQGVIPGPAGAPRVINRTTIRPLPDGRIHYIVESSTDGGDSWKATFDVYYVRQK